MLAYDVILSLLVVVCCKGCPCGRDLQNCFLQSGFAVFEGHGVPARAGLSALSLSISAVVLKSW